MTCDEARGAFSDLYDRALSEPSLTALNRHLDGCPACRAEWTAFRRAVQAVTDLGGAEPSPGFTARVRQHVEALPWWQRALRWLFLPLHVKVPIQALALVLVAFAGLLLYQRSPELRREMEPRPFSPPPVAQQAPMPAAPRTTDDAPRASAGARPPVAAPKAEQAAPPAPPRSAVAPPPQARLESEREHDPSAARDEAKEVGKSTAPPESPRATGSAEESRAKTGEPGMAARPLLRSAPAPAGQSQISPVPPASADQLYSAALADMGRQRYDPAIGSLRAFIQQHPRDARIPDARMRLADAYVALQRYADAIPEYEALAREFPDSPLRPAALYRQALARLALEDRSGCQLLREVALRFPQAPEAAAARQALSARCPE